jgi:hypothetical protein
MTFLPALRSDRIEAPSVWRRIGQLLNLLSAAECENYLRNARYAATQP